MDMVKPAFLTMLRRAAWCYIALGLRQTAQSQYSLLSSMGTLETSGVARHLRQSRLRYEVVICGDVSHDT